MGWNGEDLNTYIFTSIQDQTPKFLSRKILVLFKGIYTIHLQLEIDGAYVSLSISLTSTKERPSHSQPC